MKYTETTEIKGTILVFNRESSGNTPETFQVDTCSNVFRHALARLGWINPDEATAIKLNSQPSGSSHVLDADPRSSELQRKLADAECTIRTFCMPKPLTVKQLEQRLLSEQQKISDLHQQVFELETSLSKAQAALHSRQEELCSQRESLHNQREKTAEKSARIGRLEDKLDLRTKEVDQLTKDLAIAHDEIHRLRETGCNAVLANRIAELERKVGERHE